MSLPPLWRSGSTAPDWDETRRFVNPHEMYVDLSDRLFRIKSDLLEEMSLKSLEKE